VQNGNGNGNGKEKWMQLCEQAADEQDPKKLSILVAAIVAALDAKETRLKNLALSNALPDSSTQT
jgi:hypothetical protein